MITALGEALLPLNVGNFGCHESIRHALNITVREYTSAFAIAQTQHGDTLVKQTQSSSINSLADA